MKYIRDHLIEIFLAVISFCLLVLIFAPYWFGYRMQSGYESFFESFTRHSNHSYEVVSFDRGWFSSEAVLLVKSSNNKKLFYFNHQIIHGPVYLGLVLQGQSPFVNLVIKGQLIPAKHTDNLFASLYEQNAEPVKLNVAMKMNGNAVFAFDIPDIDRSLNGEQYKLEGAELRLEYFSESERYLGEFSAKDIVIPGALPVEVSRLIINFDQLISDQKIKGDIVLSLDSLKLRSAEQIFNINQFSARVQNQKISDLLDVQMTINASTINLFNEQANSLSLAIDTKSIVYNKLKDYLRSLSSDSIKNEKQYFNAFSSFSIKSFSFFTDHGLFNSSLVIAPSTVSIASDKNFHEQYNTTLDMQVGDMLFKRIYEISTEVFSVKSKPGDKFINKLLQFNYIEKHQNNYIVRLLKKNNKYMINDLLIPYEDFDKNLSTAIFSE